MLLTKSRMYTVENVRRGHPDKICDQISDAILDAYLAKDPMARVAVECFGCHGLLMIGGEVTSTAKVDAEKIARDVYKEIGFTSTPEIIIKIVAQSPEIADGVDRDGAGDQGIMYGYATNETPEYLPRATVLAARTAMALDVAGKDGTIPWLLPDGKTQVTIKDGKVETVVVSTQHTPEITHAEIEQTVTEKILKPIFEAELEGVRIVINPSGLFTIGGFEADTGLTGRKIMVDTYGGIIPHGGGCFSGKDATKVDRSAAYMARFAAKCLVAGGHGSEVLVSVAYAIGQADPVMLSAVNGDGADLTEVLKKNFDFRPKAIIERLGLRNPVYAKRAAYGHFMDSTAPWEVIQPLS